MRQWARALLVVCVGLAARTCAGQQPAVALPAGVRAVWDLARARREATPTRERVCINGLWRWQPAAAGDEQVPNGNWGYFKAPGSWPGITDYLQKDSQTLYAHPAWKGARLGEIAAAWYQREIAVPSEWQGRRIALQTEYLNSYAAVFVDGKRVGEMTFPAGEVDLTAACRPGGRYTLSMLVVAMPLKGVMLSYSDTTGAKQVKGTVERRGLCGDVWLAGTPKGPRIYEVRVRTSVRRWEVSFDASVAALRPEAQYALRARVTEHGRPVKEFAGKPFRAADLKGGRATLTAPWKPDRLWDLNTPGSQYDVSVSLVGAGKVADTALPARFGFRELWIQGRDFYLNGTRLFVCAVPLDNCAIGASMATYAATRETLQRLKAFGVNMVYTHNYGCEPGTHLAFDEALRAADDEGMLVSLSQPHFGQYDWRAPDAERSNGYARHAAFYTHVAGSHPSVVFYSTSHNAAGYLDDMNPDMIDGLKDMRPDWAKNGVKPALTAERIINGLDPSRIVYHHSSGDLGAMYTLNFYVNFTPIQELSDWFQHWSTAGVKPLFLCEYGVPCSWDWTMYRGWYNGKREFGSAPAPWEFCLAEWNAQFMGDRAYQIGDWEKDNLRWEARQFRNGALWHRWDYPHDVSAPFEQRFPIFADYTTDNIRAFRTLGVSGTNIWEYGYYWTLRPGTDRGRKELKVDWDNLQRPGFSPDYVDGAFEWPDLAYERADWIPTAAAKALVRNNMPLLAYIGGKTDAVTGKDHNYLPGQAVEKQLVLLNNSRRTVACACRWSLALTPPITGARQATVETGQQTRVPLRFTLPADTRPGRYDLTATVQFGPGETQTDTFAIDVLPKPAPARAQARIAIFDPRGETGAVLASLGVQSTPVAADSDLSGYDILVVGKGALTLTGAAPDIARVRDGLKVVVFEQTGDVMEKRFGFRVAEYGLRNAFRRVPDHPALAGLTEAALHDWRGEATLLPPRLKYENGPRYAPTVEWCGIPVTRVYRTSNRGNVASVLLEKPGRGDFLPVLDGGYSLQYSPLMEYREGTGLVVFCQMDVSGRTDADPAAQTLVRNLLQYVSAWKPGPERTALYAGADEGRAQIERAGVTPTAYVGGAPRPDRVLIVTPGGANRPSPPDVSAFLKAGGRVLAVGLDGQEASAFLPTPVATKSAEHIAAWFDAPGRASALAGVSPADVHNRDPRDLPLVTGGATVFGDGVLAVGAEGGVVFDQLAPQGVLAAGGNAQTLTTERYNVRRTYRRAAYTLARLLGNMGVHGATPLLQRFHAPVAAGEKRWLDGLYVDTPIEWDDPYRFFCW